MCSMHLHIQHENEILTSCTNRNVGKKHEWFRTFGWSAGYVSSFEPTQPWLLATLALDVDSRDATRDFK